MLVSRKHRKLVLNLREPDRITTVIPSARTLEYKGRTLVAVPHGLDEVRVLRNMGLDAPAPVSFYYDWPGRYQPFAHQKTVVEFLTMNPRAFNLSGMGSGKTISTLWAFDYLRKAGLVKRMLVISPLSTLERAWGDEIFRHFPDMSFAILHGTREKRHRLLAEDFDVYIINHDGVKAEETVELLTQREGLDLVVVDEIASFRNASTDRWKALNRLINGNEKQGLPAKQWVWGLTGTPIPNAPTDAWAQCRLISPTRVPRYFGQFRDAVMKPVGQFRWIPRDGALDQIHQIMQPAIRFAREDCIDLPPTTYVTRQPDLTADQKRAFDTMLRQFRAEHDGGEITAVNEAVKMSKLLQICCLRYDTNVLTRRGWVQIKDVTDKDLVWDGVEWVQQKGAVLMGRKRVVDCLGVWATPDHKVLSSKGWVAAEELIHGHASGELDWAAARLPNGHGESPQSGSGAQEGALGVPLRLWADGCSGKPVSEIEAPPRAAELRVPSRESDTFDDSDPTVPDLDRLAAQVYRPSRQGLLRLWGSRDLSLRQLAGRVREFLGRHAARIRATSDARTSRQQRGLLPGELPVGDSIPASKQPAHHQDHRNAARAHDTSAGCTGVRPEAGDPSCAAGPLQVASGESPQYAAVYDLISSGPRNQFVVLGSDGLPRVVHNCGVAYGADGSEVYIPATPRIHLVREIIEEAEAKVLVFVPYTAALQTVAAELSKDFTVAVVHGETSRAQRDQAFKDFQQAKDPRVLVANPGTLSHGLTLTAANTVVWYGPTHSNETYQQANARVTRPGQKLNTLIVNIEATPLERKIFDRLQGKERMQGLLLDLLKAA